MPNRGDRVLARWTPEKGLWYPGVVCEGRNGQVEVQFDDGDRAWLEPSAIRAFQIGAGQRVESRWQGGDAYYPGAVTQIEGNALHIVFDDGDQEWTSIRVLRIREEDLPEAR
jgi:hypothetical protein